MTWFRCGGGSGMPADLKNRMNAVFNKKFGTAVDYPPEGWPDDVNLMGPLPEKTIVSSPIADFADGADDVPTKSLVVTIPPTLSGVSSVTETQINSDNLFLLPSNDFSVSGVDFKIGSDSLTIDGTSTANISSKDSNFKTYFSFGLPKGTYYFTRGTWTKATYVYKLADDSTALVTNSGSFTLTDYTEIYIGFYIGTGQTVSEVTFEGYLKQGSSASSYSPQPHPTQYTASLGRTIYGGEVDIVNGRGKETQIEVKLKDLAWTHSTAYGGFFHSASLASIVSGDTYICLPSEYTNMRLNSSAITNNDDVIGINADNGSAVTGAVAFKSIVLKDTDYTVVSDLVSHLTQTDSTIIITIATPTDFTFDGQEINTRLGYNAFWSDSGDTEVTYRADISLALQAVSGSRGLMMASRPAIEPANGDQGSEGSTENNIETEGEEDAR